MRFQTDHPVSYDTTCLRETTVRLSWGGVYRLSNNQVAPPQGVKNNKNSDQKNNAGNYLTCCNGFPAGFPKWLCCYRIYYALLKA
jgi:hypothetical protein